MPGRKIRHPQNPTTTFQQPVLMNFKCVIDEDPNLLLHLPAGMLQPLSGLGSCEVNTR